MVSICCSTAFLVSDFAGINSECIIAGDRSVEKERRPVIVVEAIILAVAMLVLALTGEWAPSSWIRLKGASRNPR